MQLFAALIETSFNESQTALDEELQDARPRSGSFRIIHDRLSKILDWSKAIPRSQYAGSLPLSLYFSLYLSSSRHLYPCSCFKPFTRKWSTKGFSYRTKLAGTFYGIIEVSKSNIRLCPMVEFWQEYPSKKNTGKFMADLLWTDAPPAHPTI